MYTAYLLLSRFSVEASYAQPRTPRSGRRTNAWSFKARKRDF
jgi:hypothetical protein